MSNDERFLGHILKYDPINQILIIKCDFLDTEKQKVLEGLAQVKDLFSFCFKKPYRKEKTYPQLKKYYKLLSSILVKLEIFPDSDTISAFDEEIKKHALSCQELIIYDKGIPIIPSKASMSVEEMSYLIQYVLDTYGDLISDEEHQNYC
jgi:hypothetical protein